jgi:N-acetylmuramoyl-L-alanine amidase
MVRFACYLLFLTVSIFGLTSTNSVAQSIRSDEPSLLDGGLLHVILDPGHGGRDSATRADGYQEKNIVLSIGTEIKNHLIKSGFKVTMTRETDQFISLSERAATKGDVFISLHTNTVADTIGLGIRSMIKGIEIYTSSTMVSGSDILDQSKMLATIFKEQLSEMGGIRMRGTKEKYLAVLAKNQSPAILIELGFISNPDDLAFLTNPANYKSIARAFDKALKVYLESSK